MLQDQNSRYFNNPLIHQDRRPTNAWAKQFDCSDMRPLIICRGPIRKEVMDVLTEMGISEYGMLLSEKDSIVYNHALAPELRTHTEPKHVHRVPDYTGADKDERNQRIAQIIQIAKDNNYDSIFAGYGFMAEEESLVKAIEKSGLTFIGPNSTTVRRAGQKDEAKRTALAVDVSVTPGIDNVTALTLLAKHADLQALQAVVKDNDLDVSLSTPDDLLKCADEVLNAGYAKGIDLYSIEEMCAQVEIQVRNIYQKYPENRMRLKAIGGGGGKGQRILNSPAAYQGELETCIAQAAAKAPELVLEIINEVKTGGVGDNKNVLIELNIETTRHQEIQVIGNGEWAITLGARDCSVQMHEQKLLEVSQTQEALQASIASAPDDASRKALTEDLAMLQAMEDQAARFGQAVDLDSVSTFECIVDKTSHFFMEMNTRIQVEHRVSELCYSLKFTNPDNSDEYFVVDSLVQAMVLLAKHKKALPKPERIARKNASVEVRLNATNQALQPHAGGMIESWSAPIADEIRDDQGISVHNPDTKLFMKYHLAGAYDSNIALLLTHGLDRFNSYNRMAEILRQSQLRGKNLNTNLEFHYGLIHWFIANGINAKATTSFAMPYLTMIGQIKQAAGEFDINSAFGQIKAHHLELAAKSVAKAQTKEAQAAISNSIDRKQSLITRPIQRLVGDAHLLSGWLSNNKAHYQLDANGKVTWLRNPLHILDETYYYLNMEVESERPAANIIWDHDQDVLATGTGFYKELMSRLGISDYQALHKRILEFNPGGDMSNAQWAEVQGAHRAYQAGLELLSALPLIASKTQYFNFSVNPDLTINIPKQVLDSELQKAMMKVLVPPPVTKANEIGAQMGGMFYPREAPGMQTFVKTGSHFEAGDPLYIIEVMKMFNKVNATFAGTIDEELFPEGDGTIVAKGQPLFKITPDEKVVEEDPVEIAQRRKAYTAEICQSLL